MNTYLDTHRQQMKIGVFGNGSAVLFRRGVGKFGTREIFDVVQQP